MESTYSFQDCLPPMPVPDLDSTCDKLIEWAKPLLSPEELENSKKVIREFLSPGGEGVKLQSELLEWQSTNSLANWSAPVWQDIYLASRDSLVINSNVFYYLQSKLDTKTHSHTRIAAALVSSVYQFVSELDEQTLAPDMQKSLPLCMNQYNKVFSSIRLPQQKVDKFRVSSSREHIVVMANQRLYRVEIIDKNGNISNPAQIELRFDAILAHSQAGPNIGILSTLPREQWAKSREELMLLSADNRDTLQCIEEAAFVLCLDEESPAAIDEVSRQLLHGSGKDRFFDKSLQFVVFKNGKTGINFEHTGVDGSVMLRLIAHIYDTIDSVSFGDIANPVQGTEPAHAEVNELPVILNDNLRAAIDSASSLFIQHVADTSTRVLNFSQFGKDRIKQFKVSPDAFVQIALQLAEYKLYGKCYSAYEAVMTRTFLDGRIDVLYTVTPESLAFIQNMYASDVDAASRKASLIRATQKHIERAKECRFGQGVYTHLLALKYRYREAGESLGITQMPALFNDHCYQALTHAVVCTSTTSEYGVELAGYGPIVEDGYGIRYFKRNDSIRFNMTSRSGMQDKLDKMVSYIEESLLEMAELMSTPDTH